MSDTPRLRLPFLSPGQAQKELIHNEALQMLDALVCPVVNMTDGIAPPEKPAPGSCYVVPASARRLVRLRRVSRLVQQRRL